MPKVYKFEHSQFLHTRTAMARLSRDFLYYGSSGSLCSSYNCRLYPFLNDRLLQARQRVSLFGAWLVVSWTNLGTTLFGLTLAWPVQVSLLSYVIVL